MAEGQPGFEKTIRLKDLATSADALSDLPATSAALNHGGDILDDTHMALSDANRSRVYGIRDWSITGTVVYDPTDATVTKLRNAWLNRTGLLVQYLPVGLVASGFQGDCVVETFNLSGDIGGLETVDFTLQSNGALVAAV